MNENKICETVGSVGVTKVIHADPCTCRPGRRPKLFTEAKKEIQEKNIVKDLNDLIEEALASIQGTIAKINRDLEHSREATYTPHEVVHILDRLCSTVEAIKDKQYELANERPLGGLMVANINIDGVCQQLQKVKRFHKDDELPERILASYLTTYFDNLSKTSSDAKIIIGDRELRDAGLL